MGNVGYTYAKNDDDDDDSMTPPIDGPNYGLLKSFSLTHIAKYNKKYVDLPISGHRSNVQIGI